jgi:hypothetical protein
MHLPGANRFGVPAPDPRLLGSGNCSASPSPIQESHLKIQAALLCAMLVSLLATGASAQCFGTTTPTVYCTAKVNSAGCTPSIGSTGVPSASAGSGFVISTINEIHNQIGWYVYSTTGRDKIMPFFSHGTMCVKAKRYATPMQNSGGTPPCGGQYSIDFNAYIASGTNPALVAGQPVWIQTFSMDPGSPDNLSDALCFFISP